MKEKLIIIQKSLQEFELVYLNDDLESKIENFKNWIDLQKPEFYWQGTNKDLIIQDFKTHQMQKIKDMITVMIDEIKVLGVSILFVGDFYIDKSQNLVKTLVFEQKSRHLGTILESVWKEFNKMGINNFVSLYGESYELRMFYKEDGIMEWELRNE